MIDETLDVEKDTLMVTMHVWMFVNVECRYISFDIMFIWMQIKVDVFYYGQYMVQLAHSYIN